MPDRWLRVKNERKTVLGAEEDGPKYRDRSGVTGFSGTRIAESPVWIVRFYGDDETLNAIASEADVSEIGSSNAAESIAAHGQSGQKEQEWTANRVNRTFRTTA